jgi:pimeloyl-ACP methyl ester carboxylesterase
MAIPARERFVTNAAGRRIFVADWGDPHDPRLPILGLPGYSRNSRDFAHLADRLAPRRVVSLDYRGRGRSDYESDWRDYDPRGLLDDVRQVAIATGLHRFVAVGTSLGGILAMALAVAMPASLVAAVLNDVGPEVAPAGTDFLLDYMGRDRPLPDWPSVIAELRRMLPDMSFSSDADWAEFARNTFREGKDGLLHIDWDPAIVKPLTRGNAREADLWPLFRALKPFPVLVVRGGVSVLFSAATLSAMQAAHPRLRSVTLDGVGHAPTLDEPPVRQAFDALLADL